MWSAGGVPIATSRRPGTTERHSTNWQLEPGVAQGHCCGSQTPGALTRRPDLLNSPRVADTRWRWIAGALVFPLVIAVAAFTVNNRHLKRADVQAFFTVYLSEVVQADQRKALWFSALTERFRQNTSPRRLR